MNKTFIDQLFTFLGTPYGIILVAFGLLAIVKATKDRPTGWLLFSFCCFAASLNKYKDQWIREAPQLVFPLQQIRAFGRPLAIVLLILLLLLAFQTQSNWRRWIIPPAIKYLAYVQAAIFAKTILYGDQEFAIISALTFGGILVMLQRGPGRWLADDKNFHLAIKSIAVAGLIFVVVNTYQYILNPQAITFTQGRFLGTTGNPQHAGVLLAATIPCLMFLIQGIPNWTFTKNFWSALLLATIYFLLLSGSRTGILMGVVSILFFYRNNGKAWFQVILFLALIAAIVVPFLQPENLSASSTGIGTNVSDRFTSTSNTREVVWNGLLETFMNNILFGAPLAQGGRLGYGENSWLSVGAALGLVGFIPMVMMGWESVKMILQLNQLANRNSYYFFQSSAVIAGLGSLLVGSCFEAFLLGNITFSLLAFLTYLMMGGYLLEVDRFRTYHASIEEEYVEDVGIYQ
ncbi:O-antigen ligase family protein [Chamaesiphon sp. VAR_48_metabat_403]|uniref:O-antigen ligase family protein n=1 Tax=Chamaesiphon sp. VAR_48_metabat_403 TaxID=2964700 RepID=UPI00286DFE5D|nr:O-antigen ligase family protein [Chamaesiphon sp. VAR_48_metabat_403]